MNTNETPYPVLNLYSDKDLQQLKQWVTEEEQKRLRRRRTELGLKASRSRNPFIRELGRCLLGRGDSEKLAELDEKYNVGLMPSQKKLISEIMAVDEEIDEQADQNAGG